MKIKRTQQGRTHSLLLSILFLGFLSAPAAEKPNIVLLLADDLAWSALGCYGSTFYETPNIDKLAEEGLKLTTAFSAGSNCAPSRASLLSGMYTPSHGVLYVGPGTYQDKYKKKHGDLTKFKMLQPKGATTLPPADQVQTLAENLKSAGYRTGMFGKWHLGTKDNAPGKRGFDVEIESHGAHFNFKSTPQIEHAEDEYLSDFLSDNAVKFIEESADSNKPFFLYYPDFLVHAPLEAKEGYLKQFLEKTPSKNQKSPTAAAMVKSLDDSIGKIVDSLDKKGLRENTLIIFTSDNGGLAYDEDGPRGHNTSNLPLRGRKGTEYDGGIRIPWIVNWTGQVPAGTESDTAVHHVDLYPTLMKLAQAEAPPQSLAGVDLMPLFRAPGSTKLADRNLYWYLPGYSSFHTPSVIARNGQFKLIRRLESEEHLLFNTADDIGEATDISPSHPEISSRLDKAAMDWVEKTNAPRMKPNPEYVPGKKG